MILGQQQATKVLPLITNLDAYEAFIQLLEIVHNNAYANLKVDLPYPPKEQAIGQLILIDELKQLRERVKDSLNGRPELNQPLNY